MSLSRLKVILGVITTNWQTSKQKLDVYLSSLLSMMGFRNTAYFTFRFNHPCTVLLLKRIYTSLSHRTERPTN